MSTKCNVIIIESQKGFSSKVREYLQIKGASSHNVSGFSELNSTLNGLVDPILLIELPDNPQNANKFIKDLVAVRNVTRYPLIAIGKNVTSYEEELSIPFNLVVCLNKPVNNADIFEAINHCAENFVFPNASELLTSYNAQPQADSSQNRIAPPPSKNKPETIYEELNEQLPASELYSSFSSIPDMFFEQLNKLNLLGRNFQGQRYSLFESDKISDLQDYLKIEPAVLNTFNEFTSDIPKNLSEKMHRVAFLNNQIISHIIEDLKLVSISRSAALLINWSLAAEQRIYTKKDYLSIKSKAFRKELCSKIKDSAMKCALELKMSEVAEIISRTGKYIGLEDKITDEPLAIVASALAASDMVDRACWQNDHFSPRAAYKVMLMAKSGKLSDIHPIVLCCIIKILSEALSTKIMFLNVPRELRKNPALIEAARQNRDQPVAAGERKVQINELTPGMRLSKPLIAFDGREILEQDMVLDQDLIWRIWQLSMVRALNAPLVVES